MPPFDDSAVEGDADRSDNSDPKQIFRCRAHITGKPMAKVQSTIYRLVAQLKEGWRERGAPLSNGTPSILGTNGLGRSMPNQLIQVLFIS
ncbi:hypothetical protein Ddc_11372 [Ditylenchus destructor]|nr:hypothetical protein Ddc_11372 [Ditylenchus destructor]